MNRAKQTLAFLDFDVDGQRAKLSRAAAFVHSTDTRYGWSSKDIRELGGGELQRVPDMFALDHEWGNKGQIVTKAPSCGCRVIVELFHEVAPLACENFLRLCEGKEPSVGESGRPLSYKGSVIHRVQVFLFYASRKPPLFLITVQPCQSLLRGGLCYSRRRLRIRQRYWR